MNSLRKFSTVLAAAAVAVMASWTAHAEYPEKPITMIIPLGAGG